VRPDPPAPCRNCGRDLDGPFCAACGQKVVTLNPTATEFLRDFAHEFWDVDNRIFRTARLLLTRPGFLTCEYFEGRRARYVSPLRLYLAFSVLFFLVSAALSSPLDEKDRAELSEMSEQVGRMADPEFARTVEEWMPRTMFVLVPVFALLTGAVTRSENRNYPQHVYFALHVHAAVFAFGTAWMLLRWGRSEAMDVVADVTAMSAVTWYVVAAFRTTYGGTWARAVARAAAVGVAYLVAYGIVLGLLVALALFV
jgi:hypothetical protein